MRGLDCDDILQRCLDRDVPAGPINNIADIFQDPHFKARKNLIERRHERAGTVTVYNVVPRLSATPGHVATLGPDLGAHNEEIYVARLGLAKEELVRLKSLKVI